MHFVGSRNLALRARAARRSRRPAAVLERALRPGLGVIGLPSCQRCIRPGKSWTVTPGRPRRRRRPSSSGAGDPPRSARPASRRSRACRVHLLDLRAQVAATSARRQHAVGRRLVELHGHAHREARVALDREAVELGVGPQLGPWPSTARLDVGASASSPAACASAAGAARRRRRPRRPRSSIGAADRRAADGGARYLSGTWMIIEQVRVVAQRSAPSSPFVVTPDALTSDRRSADQRRAARRSC